MNFRTFEVDLTCIPSDDSSTKRTLIIYAFTAKDAAKKAVEQLEAEKARRIRVRIVRERFQLSNNSWTSACAIDWNY